jgi:pterin-4a-carbinolamine dehydratase
MNSAMRNLVSRRHRGTIHETTNTPSQLVKEYKFNDFDHMRRFVDSVFELQQHTYHNMGIYAFYPTVKVSSITMGINESTDLDVAYMQEVDSLYEDCR